MARIYVDPGSVAPGRIAVAGDAFHYLKTVLRLKENDPLRVFDGTGAEYVCRVSSLGERSAELLIEDTARVSNEPGLDICLALGACRCKSFEFAVQKTTELGVSRIMPLFTDRAPRFSGGGNSPARSRRWEKIAREAARQSGRSFVPRIDPPGRFEDALEEAGSYDLAIIPWEEEELVRIGEVLGSRSFSSIVIFIGAEGGFTAAEVEKAGSRGAIPVSLGRRILRTETAAVAAVSMAVYARDLGG